MTFVLASSIPCSWAESQCYVLSGTKPGSEGGPDHNGAFEKSKCGHSETCKIGGQTCFSFDSFDEIYRDINQKISSQQIRPFEQIMIVTLAHGGWDQNAKGTIACNSEFSDYFSSVDILSELGKLSVQDYRIGIHFESCLQGMLQIELNRMREELNAYDKIRAESNLCLVTSSSYGLVSGQKKEIQYLSSFNNFFQYGKNMAQEKGGTFSGFPYLESGLDSVLSLNTGEQVWASQAFPPLSRKLKKNLLVDQSINAFVHGELKLWRAISLFSHIVDDENQKSCRLSFHSKISREKKEYFKRKLRRSYGAFKMREVKTVSLETMVNICSDSGFEIPNGMGKECRQLFRACKDFKEIYPQFSEIPEKLQGPFLGRSSSVLSTSLSQYFSEKEDGSGSSSVITNDDVEKYILSYGTIGTYSGDDHMVEFWKAYNDLVLDTVIVTEDKTKRTKLACNRIVI